MHRISLIGLVFLASFVRLTGQGVNLSNGNWIQLGISKEGIYKISIQDLKNAGLDVNGKDARKLIVYSHQGHMLPEINSRLTHGSKPVAIYVEGENDGVLDNGDYVLFYARAPHQWYYTGSSWRHRINFYEDITYFYVGFSDAAAPRISQSAYSNQPPDMTVSRTEILNFYEKESENPNHMGRTWLGEKMGNETLTRSVNLTLPTNADDSAVARISLGGAMIDANGSVNVNLNGSSHNWSFTKINTEFVEFDLQERMFNVKVPLRNLQAQFTLQRPNSKSSAWIDFVELFGWSDIQYSGTPLVVRNRHILFLNNVRLRLVATPGTQLWNVSDPFLPVNLELSSDGAFFNAFSGQNQKKDAFVLFKPDEALSPSIIGKVSSPDIMTGNAAELIIITHPDFINAAKRIAALRIRNQGYAVKVTELGNIYRQFSTGQQDIVAIRDYLRCESIRSKSAGKELKYVLLLGASSYDPKNRIPGNTNFITTYHYDAPNKAATYALDDFYAYIDSATGDPARTNNKMRFAIGRIPCRTATEAEAVAAKLERYDSSASLGDWRANLAFVTDDVDKDREDLFTAESEKYAVSIDTTQPYMYVNKIFSDAFKQVSTGNTERYPEVNAAINRNIENGCLFMNYQGHGGPEGWAQESILDKAMIRSWKNQWKMPVLFTATCEFGLFDDPKEQSAGELALLNPNGGPIALMTTTRLVFVTGNEAINNDFWTRYGFPAANEPVPTLGEIFMKLKNRPVKSSEDNKFSLLGDPSMPLAFPKHSVVLDSINGKSATGFDDTLKAFSVVKLKGHIDERLKGKFSNFNGKLWIKVLDKPQKKSTLVNDGIGGPVNYLDQSSYIYKGVVSVTNGDFEVVFAIPKDISYSVGFGKMLFYAHNGKTDAAGGLKVKIGSSEEIKSFDSKGPVVKVYMNDTLFKYGSIVGSDADLVARVFDESGLNSTGAGIGRDMLAILDEGTENESLFVLNDYFSYDLNSYTRGTIRLPLKNLSGGQHTIKVKVWDIFNNSGEGQTKFEVNGEQVIISEFSAFPNPFKDGFKIRFTHNQAGEDLDVKMMLYNQFGALVAEKQQKIFQAENVEITSYWDLNDLVSASGLFYYKVMVSSSKGSASFSGKIIKN